MKSEDPFGLRPLWDASSEIYREIAKICDAHGFSGLAEKQTEKFLAFVKKEVLDKNAELLGFEAQVTV